MKSKGLFITFEGIEACGKTTQIALLSQALATRGRTIHVMREPGGTPIGEAIRSIFKSPDRGTMVAETEVLLLSAARAQLVQERILPALLQGGIVLCDRFYDSTIAYQGYGRGLNPDFIEKVTAEVVRQAIPDLTFLLDISVAESRRRLIARSQTLDRLEREGDTFFNAVVKGYHVIALDHPKRVHIVDGSQSMDHIAQQILNVVAAYAAK